MPAPPANPFWRFSLRVYRMPGVEQACLALQERCGADVNLLLFCGWTGSQGHRLDQRKLRAAIRVVGPWQSEVIAPLRLARRALKHQSAAGPAAAIAASCRKRIAALELDLERAEQALLADLHAQWTTPPQRTPRRQAIEASLACYIALLAEAPTPDDLAHVARIAQACSPARNADL